MIDSKTCKACCLKQIEKLENLLKVDAKNIVEEFITLIEKNTYNTAPEYAEFIFSSFETLSKIKDPYKEIKDKENNEAKLLFNSLTKELDKDLNYFDVLINLSICGNIIDYGVYESIDLKSYILNILDIAYFKNDVELFKKDIDSSTNILYIADNAGEIIFDIELIKYLNKLGKNISLAVRAKPVINDISIDDIADLEIPSYVTIVNSGCNTPGVILKNASNEFKELFYTCDLVISKGQGNFETLYFLDKKPNKLFFLFMIKCKVIADLLNTKINMKALLKA